jgi:exodeoxyribonuclease VII large subunit
LREWAVNDLFGNQKPTRNEANNPPRTRSEAKSPPRQVYTVSQVNTLIKTALENTLPGRLTVTGQISDWKVHSKGHCYFSLKDRGGVLPCVMWASSFAKVKFKPENGLAVFATGYIDVYPPQGKYQFYIERMEPAGVGALQLAFEQMVKRLEAQGLFAEAHKRPLPKFPQRIGILTSESGAALQDIIKSIFDRWPCVKLCFYPVPVQGEGAAEKIAAAIKDVNRRNNKLKLDVLIVGRGGGSLEDLWAFNEEVLARAIYDSKIPVISAVGHEVDTTIADLVADARASTPTKAGIVAVPDMRQVLEDLENKKATLNRNIMLCVQYGGQQLDEVFAELVKEIKELLADGKDKLHHFYEEVIKIEPHRLLGRKTVEVNELRSQINAAVAVGLNRMALLITAQDNRLAGLNPKAVLKRGYSITTLKQTGSVVKSIADVQIGDDITTELAGENLIESRVIKK